jgi:hypothetical protein
MRDPKSIYFQTLIPCVHYRSGMSKKKTDWVKLFGKLSQCTEVYEELETSCDDDQIAEIEDALGRTLPDSVAAILRVSDGARLHLSHQIIHLASRTQLVAWHKEGAIEDLGVFPFAHDGDQHLLVLDPDGEWGGAAGTVYRLQLSLRPLLGSSLHGAVRLSGSMRSLIKNLMKGRDLW